MKSLASKLGLKSFSQLLSGVVEDNPELMRDNTVMFYKHLNLKVKISVLNRNIYFVLIRLELKLIMFDMLKLGLKMLIVLVLE